MFIEFSMSLTVKYFNSPERRKGITDKFGQESLSVQTYLLFKIFLL